MFFSKVFFSRPCEAKLHEAHRAKLDDESSRKGIDNERRHLIINRRSSIRRKVIGSRGSPELPTHINRGNNEKTIKNAQHRKNKHTFTPATAPCWGMKRQGVIFFPRFAELVAVGVSGLPQLQITLRRML